MCLERGVCCGDPERAFASHTFDVSCHLLCIDSLPGPGLCPLPRLLPTRADLNPGEHLTMSGDVFMATAEWGVLLASRG